LVWAQSAIFPSDQEIFLREMSQTPLPYFNVGARAKFQSIALLLFAFATIKYLLKPSILGKDHYCRQFL
jgi:hypothetical protein